MAIRSGSAARIHQDGEDTKSVKDFVSRATILIAEDTPIQAKKLKYYLEQFGYDVLWALNGREAFEKLSRSDREVSLVISDLQMPEMDGLQFLEAARADARFERLPFVILTTVIEEEAGLKAYALKVNDFLAKPFRPEELKLRVENLISLSQYDRLLADENRLLNEELLAKNKLLEENYANLKKANDELKSLQAQLVMTAKMASLGVLSSGLAHEINNPLSIISSYSDQLREVISCGEFSEERVSKINDRIHNSIGRIVKIVNSLRDLASNQRAGGEGRMIEVNGLIEGLGDFFLEHAARRGVKVDFDLSGEKLAVLGQPTLLQQAFLNLVHNAIDAMESVEHRRLSFSTRVEGAVVEVRVRDTGTGIPSEIMDRIFEPFFTTKAPGKGTGLGLSLVYRFVKDCGGEITCESGRDGTCFLVRLPLIEREA